MSAVSRRPEPTAPWDAVPARVSRTRLRKRRAAFRLLGVLLGRLALLSALGLSLAGCAPRETPPGYNCTLRIGTSGDYAPFSMRSPQGSEGLDISLAERLGRALGCNTRLVPFRWPALLDQLERGDFDIALSGITMRPERALAGVFSRPYARTGVVLITAPGHPLKTLDEVNRRGVLVAVNRGGHLERWAREHLSQARIETVNDNRSLPDQLRSGRVAAIVTDTAEAAAWSPHGDRLGPFSTDYKAALIHPMRRDLSDRVDRWLVESEADGTLERLRRQFLGPGQARDAAAATVQAVTALTRLRLSLMPMVAAAKTNIGKTVADSSQETRVIERARAWSHRSGARIDDVFRVLIDLAKAIQRRADAGDSALPEDAPSLDELRIAIRNVDRQLVRELDRLPSRTRQQWQTDLAPLGQSLPLEAGEIDDLAAALSRPL